MTCTPAVHQEKRAFIIHYALVTVHKKTHQSHMLVRLKVCHHCCQQVNKNDKLLLGFDTSTINNESSNGLLKATHLQLIHCYIQETRSGPNYPLVSGT